MERSILRMKKRAILWILIARKIVALVKNSIDPTLRDTADDAVMVSSMRARSVIPPVALVALKIAPNALLDSFRNTTDTATARLAVTESSNPTKLATPNSITAALRIVLPASILGFP